ncbi:hypothetical protein ACFL4W_03455, partial [Planctomycetota bacterium]
MNNKSSIKRIVAISLFLSLAALISVRAEEAAVPEIVKVSEESGPKGNRVILYKHKAVTGMDSPGYVKKGFEHHFSLGFPVNYVEGGTQTYALLVSLHGFGDTAKAYSQAMVRWFGDTPAIILAPNDPLGSWFYGYSDQLPDGDPNKGVVVNYTERRILFYLKHVKAAYP